GRAVREAEDAKRGRGPDDEGPAAAKSTPAWPSSDSNARRSDDAGLDAEVVFGDGDGTAAGCAAGLFEGLEAASGRADEDGDHSALLRDERRDREGRLARMLEDDVDVDSFSGDVPDRLAELPGLLHPRVVAGLVLHRRELSPALEIFPVEDGLRPERLAVLDL